MHLSRNGPHVLITQDVCSCQMIYEDNPSIGEKLLTFIGLIILSHKDKLQVLDD